MREISATIGFGIAALATALLIFVLVVQPHRDEQAALRACERAIRAQTSGVTRVDYVAYHKVQDGFTALLMVCKSDEVEYVQCRGTLAPAFVFSIEPFDSESVH